MADRWMIQSHSFTNCNCAVNCGCQFNLSSTHGFCQFVTGGRIVDGRFNGIALTGLNWVSVISWPGEIPEGGGTRQIVIDERADAAQRRALETIVAGESCAPGSNHFSVFASMCSTFLDTRYLPIEIDIDIPNRTARIRVPGLIDSRGEPIVDAFSSKPFHIALARPTGSFEFTYAEIGTGTSTITGALPLKFDRSYGQFCVHHYDQDGLVRAA